MRIDPPPSPVSTARLADPGRGPVLVVLLATAFVVAATASSLVAGPSASAMHSDGSDGKATPAALAAGAGLSRVTGSVSLPPSATEEPSLQPGEVACEPAGWRLAYEGSIGSWQVATSLVIEPVAAADPLDPSIPIAELGHDVVFGLGACAPTAGTPGSGRPAVIERAWRLRAAASTVATPMRLVALGDAAAAAGGSRSDALRLLRPADSGSSWAPGEYVLEIASPETVGASGAPGQPTWLRIQLESPTP